MKGSIANGGIGLSLFIDKKLAEFPKIDKQKMLMVNVLRLVIIFIKWLLFMDLKTSLCVLKTHRW